MALYSELPVYKVTYELLREVVMLARNVNRDYRFTLCSDLREKLTEIMIRIYRANRTVEKKPHIAEARELLVEVKIYVRILADFRQISDKQYASLANKSELISKQLAAWEKSVTTL